MTSFQLSVTPHRRAAARFVDQVRRTLQRAYAESPDIRQTDIANALGVHRSVINRQLRGYKDMTLSRVAELAWAMGREPNFLLEMPERKPGDNCPPVPPGASPESPFRQVLQSTSLAHSSAIKTFVDGSAARLSISNRDWKTAISKADEHA